MNEDSGLTMWFALLVIAVLGWVAFAKVATMAPVPEANVHADGVYFCPQCWTLFGKHHSCCPEEEAYGECVELKPTPYKSWQEYTKGSWRPWDENRAESRKRLEAVALEYKGRRT